MEGGLSLVIKIELQWISKALPKCIAKKNRMFILSKSETSPENVKKYKLYHNRLTSILRKAERDYFCEQPEVNKSDMKKSWKGIKHILSKQDSNIKTINYLVIDNEKIYDRKTISNTFNNFFTSIGTELDKKIKSTKNHISHMKSINNSFFQKFMNLVLFQ